MKKVLWVALGFSVGAHAGGPDCSPDSGSTFLDFQNKAFTISSDVGGNNSLFSQCTNMTGQQLISEMDGCGPLTHPIDGLGLNPNDLFLYGLMPTDTMGIGSHVSFDVFPFPSPGEPGDMMKADPVAVYRIGSDAGYQLIGSIDPPAEDLGLPAGEEQVIPIVHSASTFDESGDLFLLGYKTNYESSANVMAMTGEVLYKTPQIMIGQVSSAALTAASGASIPATWSAADTSGSCSVVMDAFTARTNTFSECVVADYIANGNADNAVATCMADPLTTVLDYGIHDFAVSPTSGNFFAFDTTSIDGTDVLIEVDANTMQATCTDFADATDATGVLTSLMFSEQNKLVAVFADETTARWIDVGPGPNTGTITTLSASISPFPFGDGSSLPFALPRQLVRSVAGFADLIFKSGFEDLIFADGFGNITVPPGCPSF